MVEVANLFSCLVLLHNSDPTTTPDSSDTGTKEVEDTSQFDQTKLSLYIVLPIFLFCYGGSCVLYCSHKLYRSCKRKKREKMLLTKMEIEEYEPDTKPKFQPQPGPKLMPPGGPVMGPRPFTPNKRAVIAPAPYPMPQRMAFNKPMPPPPPPEPERPVRTPVQNIRIPSPKKEDEKKPEQNQKAAPPPKIPPTPPDDDLYSSRPQTTARDVNLEVQVISKLLFNTRFI